MTGVPARHIAFREAPATGRILLARLRFGTSPISAHRTVPTLMCARCDAPVLDDEAHAVLHFNDRDGLLYAARTGIFDALASSGPVMAQYWITLSDDSRAALCLMYDSAARKACAAGVPP